MSDPRPTEAIEAELREVEFRRLALLEELREQKSKSLLSNPALSFDEREYPDTAEKRVALFEND